MPPRAATILLLHATSIQPYLHHGCSSPRSLATQEQPLMPPREHILTPQSCHRDTAFAPQVRSGHSRRPRLSGRAARSRALPPRSSTSTDRRCREAHVAPVRHLRSRPPPSLPRTGQIRQPTRRIQPWECQRSGQYGLRSADSGRCRCHRALQHGRLSGGRRAPSHVEHPPGRFLQACVLPVS